MGKEKKITLAIVAVVAALVIGACGISLYTYYSSAARSKDKLEELAAIKKELAGQQTERVPGNGAGSGGDNAEGPGEEPDKEPDKEPGEVAGTVMQELAKQYEDIIGWISIEGTNIDYPVMQTEKEDGEYYLYRDYKGNEDINGTLFLDVSCDINRDTSNLLIHGHNMKSGYMFAELLEYKSEDYYKEHAVVCLETAEGMAEYEIFAAGLTQVANKGEEAFRYYYFTEYNNEEEFNYFVENVINLSYYKTDIDVKYGDTLLTLSTCDRSIEDGRLFVVARKR